MPAAPELRGGLGNVGIVEVFRQAEAEDPAQADGHIRIAGEVEIQLEGVGDAAQPRQGHGQPVSGGKGRICNDTQGVGQQHLLGQAEAKPGGARRGVLAVLLPLRQSGGKLTVAQDGPLQQLWEKGHEQRQPGQAPLRRDRPPVDVGQIRHGLEGEKGEACGQGNGWTRHIQSQRLQVFQQEAGVLKVSQHQQIARQGNAVDRLAALVSRRRPQRRRPVAHTGNQQGRQQCHAAPAVKGQTENQQHSIAAGAPPGGKKKIADQHRRQKAEQKHHTAKGHPITSLS